MGQDQGVVTAELDHEVAVAARRFELVPGELGQGGRSGARPDPDPVVRLRAICAAYLDFAQTRPQRYPVMFGGVRNVAQALAEAMISEADAAVLGQNALAVTVYGLQACADAGRSSSSDPRADGIALWLGLHGLAHQRVAVAAFAWPEDIALRSWRAVRRSSSAPPWRRSPTRS